MQQSLEKVVMLILNILKLNYIVQKIDCAFYHFLNKIIVKMYNLLRFPIFTTIKCYIFCILI